MPSQDDIEKNQGLFQKINLEKILKEIEEDELESVKGKITASQSDITKLLKEKQKPKGND